MAGYIGANTSSVTNNQNAAERRKKFTFTANTTALTGLNFAPAKIHIFHNGIRLVRTTDYTEAADGKSVTLVNAAQAGDEVVAVTFAQDPASNSDFVSALTGGTFSGDVTMASGTTLDVSAGTLFPSAGQIIQTVIFENDQTQTNHTVVSSNVGFVNTGNTATITPKFATSKILIDVHDPIHGDADQDGHNTYAGWRLYRGTSTVLKTFANGGSENTTMLVSRGGQSAATTMSTMHLDSPATTSAVTYKTMMQRSSPSNRELRINWPSTQSMTLMEIAQ